MLKRNEWTNSLRDTPSGQEVLAKLKNRQKKEAIRNVVGNLRLRQIQAQQSKKKVRDHVTRLMSGRVAVKHMGQGNCASDLDSIDRAIAEKCVEYRSLTASYYQACSDEDQIKKEVGNPYLQLTNDLPRPQCLIEMDADFIATVSAIDVLDPDVRAFIISNLDFSQINDGLLPPGESFPADLPPTSDYITYGSEQDDIRVPAMLVFPSFACPLPDEELSQTIHSDPIRIEETLPEASTTATQVSQLVPTGGRGEAAMKSPGPASKPLEIVDEMSVVAGRIPAPEESKESKIPDWALIGGAALVAGYLLSGD